MPDQLHLVQRVGGTHRRSSVGLVADDERLGVVDGRKRLGQLLGGLLTVAGHRQSRGRLGHRCRGVPAMMNSAAVVGLAEPSLEFEHAGIQRGVEICGAGLGADDRSLAVAGDLDALAHLGLAGILLVGELDVEPDDAGVQAFRQGHFLGDMAPEVLGYVNVAAFDDDVHADPPVVGDGTTSGCPAGPGRAPHSAVTRCVPRLGDARPRRTDATGV